MPSKIILPWENWYHCMGSTYGSWLYGDRRGFRTRHHREHVDGDYRNPPPQGKYDAVYERSLALLKKDTVRFGETIRPAVCRMLCKGLEFYKAEVQAFCLCATHWHGLLRFTGCNIQRPSRVARGLPKRERRETTAYDHDPIPRTVLGRVHSFVSHEVKKRGLLEVEGAVWAKRPGVKPVKNLRHWRAIDQYIYNHVEEGAAVWSIIRELGD